MNKSNKLKKKVKGTDIGMNSHLSISVALTRRFDSSLHSNTVASVSMKYKLLLLLWLVHLSFRLLRQSPVILVHRCRNIPLHQKVK